MLGAQALRTKQKFQKAEQKEKEKRHRERLRSIEIQRDKMHKAACEDAAAQYLDISADPPLKMLNKQHRHSVHAGTMQHLHITTNDRICKANMQYIKHLSGPQRSTSSDHCKQEAKKESISNSSRFLKWIGLGGGSEKKSTEDLKDLKQRRMSTFT